MPRPIPASVNFASAGVGTSEHVAGELFKMMTGVNMDHVPYRGSTPALTDLIGGPGAGHVRHHAVVDRAHPGRAARALAVTTATRWDGLPDIPTIGEFVPGYEASARFGLGAPRKTPAEIVDTLNREINAGLADPKLKARLEGSGGTVLTAGRRRSASCSPTKPRNGPRWSSFAASRRTESKISEGTTS